MKISYEEGPSLEKALYSTFDRLTNFSDEDYLQACQELSTVSDVVYWDIGIEPTEELKQKVEALGKQEEEAADPSSVEMGTTEIPKQEELDEAEREARNQAAS